MKPFKIGHAFGSSQFGNKADRGICVIRSKALGGDHTLVRFDKVKVERLMGRKGTVALQYNPQNHVFTYDTAATNDERVRNLWKG
jgi:hypothetical protein